MAARSKPRKSDQGVRVRHLLALDAALMMKRLRQRKDEMLSLFSRLRDRTPMTETVRTSFDSIRFGELALLTPKEQLMVHRFYDLLDQLRWYVRYTEDMPSKVEQTLAIHIRRLEEGYLALQAMLGPPQGEGGPVVDAAPAVTPVEVPRLVVPAKSHHRKRPP
jgi:hypothetical protein